MFLDVVHAAKERGGFKTRHLYPPQDLYEKMASLSGAVVIGSCRIGGTREVDLDLLREKAVAAWAVGHTNNVVGRCRDRNHGGRMSYTRGLGSDSGVLIEPGVDNGGDSSDAGTRWDDSNSAGSSRRSVVTDDDLCANSKISDGRSRSSGCNGGRGGGGGSSSDRISDGTDRQGRKMSDERNTDSRELRKRPQARG